MSTLYGHVAWHVPDTVVCVAMSNIFLPPTTISFMTTTATPPMPPKPQGNPSATSRALWRVCTTEICLNDIWIFFLAWLQVFHLKNPQCHKIVMLAVAQFRLRFHMHQIQCTPPPQCRISLALYRSTVVINFQTMMQKTTWLSRIFVTVVQPPCIQLIAWHLTISLHNHNLSFPTQMKAHFPLVTGIGMRGSRKPCQVFKNWLRLLEIPHSHHPMFVLPTGIKSICCLLEVKQKVMPSGLTLLMRAGISLKSKSLYHFTVIQGNLGPKYILQWVYTIDLLLWSWESRSLIPMISNIFILSLMSYCGILHSILARVFMYMANTHWTSAINWRTQMSTHMSYMCFHVMVWWNPPYIIWRYQIVACLCILQEWIQYCCGKPSCNSCNHVAYFEKVRSRWCHCGWSAICWAIYSCLLNLLILHWPWQGERDQSVLHTLPLGAVPWTVEGPGWQWICWCMETSLVGTTFIRNCLWVTVYKSTVFMIGNHSCYHVLSLS